MNKLRTKGYSFIELMAVIAIIGVVSVVMTTLIVWEMKAYKKSQDIIDAQENAAKAMREFEKITRGTTEVITSTAGEYSFLTYLAGDDHPAPSKLRFFCEDSIIKKGVISPQGDGPSFEYPLDSEVVYQVAKYVGNCESLFIYFNDVNQEISHPVPIDAVRMVKITISADKEVWEIPEEITETTSVSLRNLKTNL